MGGVVNLTEQEARQRAATVAVDAYHVDVDLTGDGETFRSTTTVRFRATAGASTFVEVRPQRLLAARLNGVDLDPAALRDGRLPLADLAADNELVVTAEYAYSHTGEGMHRFVDPADGRVYVYAQPAITQAPRFMACFDQPDLKAPVSLAVTCDPDWVVHGTSPARRTAPGRWELPPTPPISTYLITLTAGPYHVVTDTHDGIPLGVSVRASLAEHLDAQAPELFEITAACLDRYHELFGVRYPWGGYHQAFVPELSWGAMEFPGCVLLRDEQIFRSAVTGTERQARAVLIAHEMAHMWFGDLVTMRWWDDLWLNESFAEWASHWCNANATRFREAWTTFLTIRKQWAYRQDQLPSTHPVYADMADLHDVELNFDGITYAKGASVLKQLVAYVGEDAFLAGLRSYFTTHAWGNATFDDLLAALEKASGRPLRDFATTWLTTAQVNTLRPEVTVDDQGRYQRVAVRQEAPADHPTLRTHRMVVGLYDLADGALVRRDRHELDVSGELTEVPALAGVPAADLLLLNDDDLTYAKTRLDRRSLTTLVEHIDGLSEPLARGLCWAAAWDMTRDAEMPAREYVALIRRGLPAETDINLVTGGLLRARTALAHYADPAWAPQGRAAFAATALEQVERARGGLQLAWARAYAASARSDEELRVLRRWLDGVDVPEGLTVDTELRWYLLQALVAHGAAGDAEIEAELAADTTIAGQRRAATARALRPTEAAKAEAWRELVGDPAPPNWRHRALLAGFWHESQLELTEPYVARFHEVAADIWQRRTPELAREFLTDGYPATHVSEETLAASDAWLAVDGRPSPARRLIAEGRDTVARALRARAADAAAAASAGA